MNIKKKKEIYVMIPIETFRIHRLYCVRYFGAKQKKNTQTHTKKTERQTKINSRCMQNKTS